MNAAISGHNKKPTVFTVGLVSVRKELESQESVVVSLTALIREVLHVDR